MLFVVVKESVKVCKGNMRVGTCACCGDYDSAVVCYYFCREEVWCAPSFYKVVLCVCFDHNGYAVIGSLPMLRGIAVMSDCVLLRGLLCG